MLQAIRSRAGGIVIKVLFGLLILSFGFWGIYTRSDYYSEKSPETVVAKVGDHEIRADELQKAMQAALERMRQQFGQNDRHGAGQAARHCRHIAQPADRPRPARSGGGTAEPRHVGRHRAQRDLRQPRLQDAGRPFRPHVVQPGADHEPADRGSAGRAAAPRHPAQRPAAGADRRRHGPPPGVRYALSLPQREAGRRDRCVPARFGARSGPAERGRFAEILRRPRRACSAPPNSAASPC